LDAVEVVEVLVVLGKCDPISTFPAHLVEMEHHLQLLDTQQLMPAGGGGGAGGGGDGALAGGLVVLAVVVLEVQALEELEDRELIATGGGGAGGSGE
jgi:hypothetical protein